MWVTSWWSRAPGACRRGARRLAAGKGRARGATNVNSEKNRDRVLEAALARACADTSTPGSPCPEPEALAAYVERQLAPADREHVESHLASCLTCQAEVALIVRSAPPAAPRPSLAPAAWWRTRWLAWAAPAAAAATLVLAVWISSRPAPSPPAAELGPEARAEVAAKALLGGPLAPDSSRQPPGSTAGPPPSAPPDAAATTPSGTAASPDTAADLHSSARDRLQALRREPATAAPAPDEREPAARAATAAQAPAEARFSPDVPAQTPPAAAATAEKGSYAGPIAARPISPSGTGTERSAEAIARPEPEGRTAAAGAAPPTPPPRGTAPAEGAAVKETAPAAAPVAGVGAPRAAASGPGGAPARAPAVAAEPPPPSHGTVGPTRRFTSPSGRIVWEITAAGGLRRSLDGGATWDEARPGDRRLVSGTAVSDTVAWAIGREGVVWRTTDGATWMPVSRPAAVDLISIVATSEHEAVVTTAGGRTFHTADGGRTWRER